MEIERVFVGHEITGVSMSHAPPRFEPRAD